MNFPKVLLVQPKSSLREKVYSLGWCPSLALISLATYAKQRCPNLKIKIIDEEIEKLENLDGNILGLSCNLANYRRALGIAKRFKRENPDGKIVIGGLQYIRRKVVRTENVLSVYFLDRKMLYLEREILNRFGKKFINCKKILK